jgi:hypothetical protein
MARTAKEIEAEMWAKLREIRAREAAMSPVERRWEARINGPGRAKAALGGQWPMSRTAEEIAAEMLAKLPQAVEEERLKEWKAKRLAEEKQLAHQQEIDRIWQEKLDREAEARRAAAEGVRYRGSVAVDYDPYSRGRMGE